MLVYPQTCFVNTKKCDLRFLLSDNLIWLGFPVRPDAQGVLWKIPGIRVPQYLLGHIIKDYENNFELYSDMVLWHFIQTSLCVCLSTKFRKVGAPKVNSEKSGKKKDVGSKHIKTYFEFFNNFNFFKVKTKTQIFNPTERKTAIDYYRTCYYYQSPFL